MADAPERIWAVTEPDDISAQMLGDVYAQQVPDGMVGEPVKYIRADLTPDPDTFQRMVEALERIADLTQHNMPMSAQEEQCVYREARAALEKVKADNE